MVLTITVVGGQNNANNTIGNNNHSNSSGNIINQDANNHTVMSSNELAQYLSGQTVTGLLNPDGSITLNHSNLVSVQQMNTIPTTSHHDNLALTNININSPNSMPTISAASSNLTSTSSPTTLGSVSSQQFNSKMKFNQIPQINSISNSNQQAIDSSQNTGQAIGTLNIGHMQPQQQQQTQTTTTTKKTGQKRLTAKQKQALQQQQQQHQLLQQQLQDTRQQQIMTSDQNISGQQPHIVATVELPNGQIGQLIAPAGGQYWSPNAINLQQLSMAVAAATGTMPQALSLPVGAQNQSTSNQHQQLDIPSPNIQTSSAQPQGSQQISSTNNSNFNQQQVMTTVQLPNNQLAQVIGRPSQLNQIWSGGPISLQQLTSLAQQGVIQLVPIQPTTTLTNDQIVTSQGLISNNQLGMQMSANEQIVTQDPNDPGKWQIVSNSATSTPTLAPTPQLQQQQTQSRGQSSNSHGRAGDSSFRSAGNQQFANNNSGNANRNNNSSGQQRSQSNIQTGGDSSSQTQKKLKRLACTCPNCRDGDNGRSSGGDKKKQHVCHFPGCPKVYGKTSHLRAHLRWHSGERPYICSWTFCGKKFTRSDELQRHRRTHTGEKRFQCRECMKKFMRSDHLSKHLKTHLSSKKCQPQLQTEQQQQNQPLMMMTNQQQGIQLPTIVSLPQSSLMKTESMNMIDGLNLGSMGHESSQKQQRPAQGENNINLHMDISN